MAKDLTYAELEELKFKLEDNAEGKITLDTKLVQGLVEMSEETIKMRKATGYGHKI